MSVSPVISTIAQRKVIWWLKAKRCGFSYLTTKQGLNIKKKQDQTAQERVPWEEWLLCSVRSWGTKASSPKHKVERGPGLGSGRSHYLSRVDSAVQIKVPGNTRSLHDITVSTVYAGKSKHWKKSIWCYFWVIISQLVLNQWLMVGGFEE